MYFRRQSFLPCWSFVSFRIWRNVWVRAHFWDWNNSRRKVEQERKRSQIIYSSILRVLSYVSLAGKAKNERASYRKCRVYIGSHVTWTAPNTVYFVRDKIKCVDVVGSTKLIISLSNRFLKLINLPPFVSRTSESWILFTRIYCTTRSSMAF